MAMALTRTITQTYDVDPATTDAERARWHVPPLAHCLQKAEEMNQTIFSTAL